MANHVDPYDNSLVIDGFEQGVADSPFSGVADMRCANIISTPGEASVGFATAVTSPPLINQVSNHPGDITVTGRSGNSIQFSGQTGIEAGMSIVFSAVGGLTGVSVDTVYWVKSTSGSPVTSMDLYSDFAQTSAVVLGGAATGSPTFRFMAVGIPVPGITLDDYPPQQFTYGSDGKYYMIDLANQVWTNKTTTASGYWECMGWGSGSGKTDNGTGIAHFTDYSGNMFLFAATSNRLSYYNFQTNTWVYNWNPNTGGSGSTYSMVSGTNHKLYALSDRTLYITAGYAILTIFQTSASLAFDPTNTARYTYSEFDLLPYYDKANCVALLGDKLLIGGNGNIIYVWDRVSPLPSNYLFLAESTIWNMVTVNTNVYALVGNRGRIYVTNGVNATLFKKIPDHISGTVEPYFFWGGLCASKNQIYFSLYATTNGGTKINQYGGVWALDIDTKALRLSHKLSYGNYNGYATAMINQFVDVNVLVPAANPAGSGLYIGWVNDTSTAYGGIDKTTSNVYTGGETTIDSELIPIGTYQKPRDNTKIEYRLTRPLVSGESISIKTRLIFNTSDTGYSTTLTDSTAGNYSGISDINYKNAQWVQFQIVLTGTNSSPSYVRLKEIRLHGLV